MTSIPKTTPKRRTPSADHPLGEDASSRRLSAGLSDGELVRRARHGDGLAGDELARRHRKPAYFFALQLLGHPDDALDVAQDAMLRFFKHLDRFDPRRPVRPWIFRIVRNRVVDLHRRRKVRQHDSIDAPRGDGDERPRVELVDESADVEGDARHNRLRRRIFRSLDELTPNQREILVLRDYQDLSYAEIAETLEIPMGTVMSRLHGARRALRKVLGDDLRDYLS